MVEILRFCWSFTIPLLFGLIALFVEMLLDSSEAAAADDVDVVFKDVLLYGFYVDFTCKIIQGPKI